MPPSPPLTGKILRPGPVRSQLEADAYVGLHPCPICGTRIAPTFAWPAHPGDGAAWEVRANCYNCATIVQYFFDAGPGWTGDEEQPDGTFGPDPFDIHYGPPGSQTALFSQADLIQLRDEALVTLAEREADAAAAPGDAMEPLRVATAAAAVLRPMIELEAMAVHSRSPLPSGHAALRARALGLLAAIGRKPAI